MKEKLHPHQQVFILPPSSFLLAFITAGNAVVFQYESDLFGFASLSKLKQFVHDGLRRARLVPDVARGVGFRQHEARRLSSVLRIENLSLVMCGQFFWIHWSLVFDLWPLVFVRVNETAISRYGQSSKTKDQKSFYLSFGITSLPARKISRTRRSAGMESISSP